MESVRVQSGAIEPVEVLAVGFDRVGLIGLTNLKIRARRLSDGKFLDWSDNQWKAVGISQLLETLTPVDAANAPGRYQLATASHPNGLDFSILAMPAADAVVVTALQDGSPQNAGNFPQEGEIKVGDYVDHVDQAISANATPAEVALALQAIRLHQLVDDSPGATPAAAGTYVRQIIDNLAKKPEYVVLCSFGLNSTSGALEGLVWVESGNLILNSGVLSTCVVGWYDKAGVLQFTMTDTAPDAQGFYKVEKAAPGLVRGRIYYATAAVVITGFGIVSGGKGNFTF